MGGTVKDRAAQLTVSGACPGRSLAVVFADRPHAVAAPVGAALIPSTEVRVRHPQGVANYKRTAANSCSVGACPRRWVPRCSSSSPTFVTHEGWRYCRDAHKSKQCGTWATARVRPPLWPPPATFFERGSSGRNGTCLHTFPDQVIFWTPRDRTEWFAPSHATGGGLFPTSEGNDHDRS